MKDKARKNAFSNIIKTLFWHFHFFFENVTSVFKNYKENDEKNIRSMFFFCMLV